MASEDIRKRLDRFSGLISNNKPSPGTGPPARYQRLADELGGELVHTDSGCFCLVRKVYEYGYRFGDQTLERPDSTRSYPFTAFSAIDEPGGAEPSKMMFFDLETTGLGGAGTVPFLTGCGSLTDEGFEIRQYVIPDYSDEAATLEAVLLEFTERPVLVSYNGAAFDVPITRDRMIINRVARELQPERHLDLLHPTRRLFRRRLKDCTLTNIERELFGFYRVGDIPGYLIPSVYFEWLADESLGSMATVLEHNRWDIFAMHFLASKIAKVFETDGDSLDSVDDVYSLSRVYDRRKDRKKALDISQRLTGDDQQGCADDILLFRSMALKRDGQWPEALKIWQQLAGADSREGYLANEELAKYYEHRQKDYDLAFRHAQQARKSCPPGKTRRDLLRKRLVRLQTRLKS